ncbi:MAG: NmrA family NAD(P)-binding protein [Deltaproteobacteria bacterium]|nr:NmrA family NAD(P)-binding protein [Deltaproteobacteria bacterium]
MKSNIKIKVAVIGATGQFGHPLTLNLASEGADVLAVSRARSEHNAARLEALVEAGCELGFCSDPSDEKALVKLLEGCQTVVMVTLANPKSLLENDPLYLSAAKKAGVQRFVPNEFGAHTLGMKAGISKLFDAKKAMHTKIDEAGLKKTLIYPGLNADYCLPNFRFFHQITTFGNLDLLVTTHHIKDIGAIAAKAILDSRTLGKAVQLYHNRLSQRKMIELLKSNWPDRHFPIKHISIESILHDMKYGSDAVTAKAGVETDRERAQINYVCYVTGEVTNIDHPGTLNASDLYPEFSYLSPQDMLSDPEFVFGADAK